MKSCAVCHFYQPSGRGLGECGYPLRIPDIWPESVAYAILPKKTRMRPESGRSCQTFEAAPGEDEGIRR